MLYHIENKPYDLFGTWLDEFHVISGNFHWIGMDTYTSTSIMWNNHVPKVRNIKLATSPLIMFNI